MILARVARTKDSVATQGDIVGVVWKGDSTAVVCWVRLSISLAFLGGFALLHLLPVASHLQTTKGYLLFFGIAQSKARERVLEFDFRREFYYMSGPGEGKGIAPWEITPQQVLATGKEIKT